MRPATALLVLATGVASAWLLDAGYGFNIPVLAFLLGATATAAGHSAGRGLEKRGIGWWSGIWGASCLVLLCAAAWRGEPGPYWLAVLCALMVGALAIYGGRSWRAVLLAPVGLTMSISKVFLWTLRGAAGLPVRGRSNMRNAGYAVLASLALVVIFGALFASADPVFGHFWDSLGSLVPGWSPLPFLWFVVGICGALAVGYGAASPIRWDRWQAGPAKPLSRNVWLTPLTALAVLFAVFDFIQVSVLFGGYKATLRSAGMTYAEYARQGFWQLIGATALTLIVIALAIRWSPRGERRDSAVASAALCALCVLALVVVGSALRRMQLDIDAYGLTLPRVAVVAIESWLGLLFVILAAARCRPATRWLPYGVVLSAVFVVGAYVGIGPSHLVAQVDVNRYYNGQNIDLSYLENLPKDAQPEIDRLPPQIRSCLLGSSEFQQLDCLPSQATQP